MHTGDLATIDAEGYCAIVGRIKDMVIRGGENVYPREVEEFLYKHPKIVDVQVFGVPDPKYGEEICAWIKLRDDATMTQDEVRAFCRDRIAHYKVPRHVRFVQEFPMTVTGKMQKYLMREAMERELAGEARHCAGIHDATRGRREGLIEPSEAANRGVDSISRTSTVGQKWILSMGMRMLTGRPARRAAVRNRSSMRERETRATIIKFRRPCGCTGTGGRPMKRTYTVAAACRSGAGRLRPRAGTTETARCDVRESEDVLDRHRGRGGHVAGVAVRQNRC